MHGFNGFSYADIAAELRITKASLHYHYPSKEELGEASIDRYHRNFHSALHGIRRETNDASVALRQYVDLYAKVLKQGRMCLCGMLAAEYTTLPQAMRKRVRAFFTANEE